MVETQRKSARIQLLLIAAVFFGPLLVAAWMYYGGHFLQPEGKTNHGELLEPIVSLTDALPASELRIHNQEHWLLLYAGAAPCENRCQDALYTLRQSRLMLGKEMQRVKRIFLHGDTSPDTVFIAEEHQGLITLQDANLEGLLDNKKPAHLPAGGFYLIDPLGNLVMYFRPDIDPSDMVNDLKRLLKLSRIG